MSLSPEVSFQLAEPKQKLRMPVSACWLALLMIVTSVSSFAAQTLRSANLQVGHESWTFKDGAPPDVACLAQTNDGFLWLCAPNGLVRFDGTRFEPFKSPFGDRLLSTQVYSLLAPPSGGLWVGYTLGGFSFLNNGQVTNYGGEIASSTGTVWDLAQDRDGIVWAATSSGLWRFDHLRWQPIGVEWNSPAGIVTQVGFDSKGILWALAGAIGTPMDLIYLLPGTSHFKAAGRNLSVSRFTLDADGVVMTDPAAPPMSGSNESSEKKPTAYPTLTKDSEEFFDRNNSLWISYDDKPIVMRLPAGRPGGDLNGAFPAGSESYDMNPFQMAQLVDREGNIWFGDLKGIHRFSYSPLNRPEFPKGALGNADFAVVADDDGAVWISSRISVSKSDLYYVSGGKAQRRLPQVTSSFAYRAPDKTFWFSGEGCLWHLVGRDFVRVNLPREVANRFFYLQAITKDAEGGIWVSFGRHGLYRLADGIWTPDGGRHDLPKSVMVAFTDGLGRVWFGYWKSQLAVLDGDRVRVFGPSDGLQVGNITAIYGRGSEIWIGGELGLEQFDHGRFHSIAAVNDEWLRGISGIVETANGDLWLNAISGIFHIRKAEISAGLKDSNYRVKGEHFGRREGIPGIAPQIRPLPTAIEGTDGRLWFTFRNGVVWLDAAGYSERQAVPPPITFQSVTADDKSYAPASRLSLPAHTSSVQISYSAVSLSDPEAIRFRYKLRETDKDWHEVAASSPVTYRNLAPGSYHFNVGASDINGVWSDQIATAEFTILPAFYQAVWFRSLCVILFLAAVAGLYQLRLRQLARQFDMTLNARVGERTRIARELHDTLLQSFHALLLRFQAASELLSTRPAEAKQTLDRAMDQAAQAITEGRDAVQGLRASVVESNDLAVAIRTFGEELAAEQAGDGSVVLHVVVEGTPRILHPVQREEIYRIACEALRNAFKHARAAQIEVELRYDERQLRLRVRDDGKGIDPQFLTEEGRAGHYGLQGMRERAKLMSGKLTVRSAPGSGAEVELSIPAARAYATSTSTWGSWFAKKSSGEDVQNES